MVEQTMEKHIDTMGFILAAIVISVTLIADRESRRSDERLQNLHSSQDKLRQGLRERSRITPALISDWVRRAKGEGDSVVTAARVLNYALILIVLMVGMDALRLLIFTEAERPADAWLLITGLMVGALVTGLYGEVHLHLERAKFSSEFGRSDLGLLSRISDLLAPAARRTAEGWRFEQGAIGASTLRRIDAQVEQVSERFPEWELVPELRAMSQLVSGKSTNGEELDAVRTLLEAHAAGDGGYNLPILLTAALTRSARLEEALPLLNQLAPRRGPDRILDELRFDLGLAGAHRDQLFGRGAPTSSVEPVEQALAFDLTLEHVRETDHLRKLGRIWSDADTPLDWRPDLREEDRRLPLSWFWQIVHREEPDGDMDAVREWRDRTADTDAVESLGFACLASGRSDDAVELFETAVRLNSSSGNAHWGAALAYFQRSWRDKGWTSLKRARTCGFSPPICDLTEARFDGLVDQTYQNSLHNFDGPPDLAAKVDLGLLGIVAPVPTDPSPKNRLATAFLALAGSSVAIDR